MIFTFTYGMVNVDGLDWWSAYPSLEIDGKSAPVKLEILTFFRDSDLPNIIGNLAMTPTSHIRQFGGDKNVMEDNLPWAIDGAGSVPVKGMSYEVEAYIKIRWQWLAFPASLLVLTILYFIFVVVQSATSDTPVWKSSPLTLLYHGLDQPAVERGRDITEVSEMEKHAKGMKVRLQDARLRIVSGEESD